MTLSIQQIAKRLSTHSRRALLALFLSGSTISSIAFAENDNPPIASSDMIGVAQVESDASDVALDYWIFSDDYCGWASAEAFSKPYSIDPFATEPVRKRGQTAVGSAVSSFDNVIENALAASLRRDAMAIALDELAKSEPIDVTKSHAQRASEAQNASGMQIASSKPDFRLSGSSPVIVSIAEGYLPYDLDRADQISLRMYPITIPRFNYLDSDRRPFGEFAGRGPLDCLGHGVVWTQSVAPSVSVETKPVPNFWGPVVDAWKSVHRFVTSAAREAKVKADARQAELATAILEAAKVNSGVQQSISPFEIGKRIGVAWQSSHAAIEGRLKSVEQNVASWNFENREPQFVEQQPTAGNKLLVRAGIEADALDCATAGVADVAAPMDCPAERLELAAQPPATYSMAAVGVAAATLSMPQVPQEQRDEITRAEAIATACQSTAATLERLATALRRAGDSVVRVARASAEGGTDLR